MFRVFLVWVLVFSGSLSLMANTTAEDFQKSKDYARALRGQPLQAMNQFQPKTTFKDYNETPAQGQYYPGIEVEHTDLSTPATKALKEDRAGTTVVANFGTQQFEINKNNPAIKNAQFIEEQSHALTHGTSNSQVNCDTPPKACEIKTHEEFCHTSRQLPSQNCLKKLFVSVNSEHINQRADFEVWVAKKWTGVISVNLVTGVMSNGQGGHLTNPIKLTHPCDKMKATVHSILNNGQRADWVSVASAPSCQNNGVITLNVAQKFGRYYPLHIALTIDAQSKAYVSEEHWVNECLTLEHTELCHKKEEQCTDKTPTRLINGLPVTRACWQYDARYSCASAKADECRTQQGKGCLQTKSRCSQRSAGTCTLYEQVYSCQEQVCPATVACVKNLFCADGECVQPLPTHSDNFGTSIAPLAAVGAGGSDFSTTQALLFSGHRVQCKIWALDLVDCCSNKGWADKIHLNLCREEDKALVKSKLSYLAHYVGSYCSKKVLGACTEHQHTYCVFDSKMARIIQEEGRLKQLNPNALGDAELTTCSGVNVSELQHLDMSRIDFVAPIYPYPQGVAMKEAGIVGDMALKEPNRKAAMDEIKRRIEERAAKP